MPDIPIDRRRFGTTLAAGAMTAAPLAVQAAAGEPAPAAPAAAAADSAGLVLQRVAQEYPDRLEPEHLEQIRRQIERHQAVSKVLSGFPLTNADEPATVFAAYRKE